MQDGYSAGEEYWSRGCCLSNDLQVERRELRMKMEREAWRKDVWLEDMKDCFDRGITIATAFYTKWSQTEDWQQDCIVRQMRNVRYVKYLSELAPWREA